MLLGTSVLALSAEMWERRGEVWRESGTRLARKGLEVAASMVCWWSECFACRAEAELGRVSQNKHKREKPTPETEGGWLVD